MTIAQSAIDYGPLAHLIGTWQGEKGLDISPEIDGEEQNIYRETIVFKEAFDVTNADEQALVALHYHQIVTRLSDEKIIHNETGYYAWDQNNNQIIKSFSIPRGIAIVAGGRIKTTSQSDFEIELTASLQSSPWGISQSPFMQQKAKTESYQFSLSLSKNELSYSQNMQLAIFGKKFTHQDKNILVKK